MRSTIAAVLALLFVLVAFPGCDNKEELIERVNNDVPRKMERSLAEKGYDSPRCRLVGENLITIKEDRTYKGVIECASPQISESVRVQLQVNVDGDDYVWNTH